MVTNTPTLEAADSGYLVGQLLIAMPVMRDPRFARSVIYMCAHSEEGAMGLILNQPASDITFADLLDRLEIYQDSPDEEPETPFDSLAVRTGGPVETSRGFVLHSPDYFVTDTTLPIDENICLTATVDILKAIASGTGPDQAILALGYAGWSPGQLESEIQSNGWLHCPAHPDLMFSEDLDTTYTDALAKIGVDPSQLVSDAGHA